MWLRNWLMTQPLSLTILQIFFPTFDPQQPIILDLHDCRSELPVWWLWPGWRHSPRIVAMATGCGWFREPCTTVSLHSNAVKVHLMGEKHHESCKCWNLFVLTFLPLFFKTVNEVNELIVLCIIHTWLLIEKCPHIFDWLHYIYNFTSSYKSIAYSDCHQPLVAFLYKKRKHWKEKTQLLCNKHIGSHLVSFIHLSLCLFQMCQICLKDDNEAELLLCDGCDKGYHTYCFKPKMEDVPDGDWFCPECVTKVRVIIQLLLS